MYFYRLWYLIWSYGCLLHLDHVLLGVNIYHWLSSFHNGLKHFCPLKLVSISRVTLWKVLFGLFFSKCSCLRLQNFISPIIKYPNNLIISVVVCICKIHVFNGLIPCQIIQSFLDHVNLISSIFLKFSVVVGRLYHRDINVLEILACTSKHFRINSAFNKCRIGVPWLTF